ncbi:MAG: hypothetical protein KJ915_02645 [Candidatus Omnitrophica bacterium]|nr:hypothetical protein [Candidatus Omnitrophota bacterium]
MWKIRIFLLILSFVIIFCGVSYAATYYVDGSVANDFGNGSISSPKKYLQSGISLMSGGDTLIIRDGTYTQSLTGVPSGSANNYTNVKAENNFGVKIVFASALNIRSSSRYIRIEGIKFNNNNNLSSIIQSSDHIKIIRCSFTGSQSIGNIMTVTVNSSSYILLEECWAWGTGRYKFLVYESDHVILRRCVSRHDYHNDTQCATFTRYDSPNVEFQNCIAIDSGLTDGSNGGFYGGIWNENNAEADTTGKDLGCIILNIRGASGLSDWKVKGIRKIENCVIWDAPSGIFAGDYRDLDGQMYINHTIIGNMINDGSSSGGMGLRNSVGMPVCSISNSIVTQCPVYGLSENTLSDWNSLYGNNIDYNGVSDGNNDKCLANYNAIDPLDGIPGNGTSSLKYLLRVEQGSDLWGAASDGGNIGATVLKMYGVSETLWGDPGYETLTDENLWPFPNEAEIRSDMRTWAGGYVSGTRGFCSDGQTLTQYIWGYLGNPIPFLAVPSNLSAVFIRGVQSGVESFIEDEIILNWEDNSLEEYGYRVERKECDYGYWTQIAELPQNSTSYSDQDIVIGLTYCYRIKAFKLSEETTYSNEALVIADASTASESPVSSGGGGGCFIATAAFGTPMAKEVISLCQFRDNYLLRSCTGRTFVAVYYRYSPAIADSIRDKEQIKAFVRILLEPLIFFTKLLN